MSERNLKVFDGAFVTAASTDDDFHTVDSPIKSQRTVTQNDIQK